MGNYFGKCVDRYFAYKWFRRADQAFERRKAEKIRRKGEKARMIATYGYQYYLRDKTWHSIKNQKKRESFDFWQYRLALYGFTVDGFDTKYSQQHYSKPLVHTYRFFSEKEITTKGEAPEMTDVWNKILSSYSENPRDVLTFGKRKYFYVYVEKGDVYIERGREHENASAISVRRPLDKKNLEVIYEKYKTNVKAGKIIDITFHSVYWFGIFRDLNL